MRSPPNPFSNEDMNKNVVILILTAGLSACASKLPLIEESSLENWINLQRQRSWDNLQKVISPEEPKAPQGPRPLKGVVVAALSKKDPDYYFHWTRDSAHVMKTVLREPLADASVEMAKLKNERWRDYVELSRRLQNLKSPYGLGEPRYTVEGQIDSLKWSRPQYDGPALRALTLMSVTPVSERTLAAGVIRRDLLFLLQVYRQPSFDLWEEMRAQNYHTLLVQLSAFEQSENHLWIGLERRERAQILQAIKEIQGLLEQFWYSGKGYFRSQINVVGTDGYTKKSTDLDSALVVAVIDGDRRRGLHSILDPRVQATVRVLEKTFQESYPLNQKMSQGLVAGRYQGDIYFGGNPWYLVTAYYAQFYYRLAAEIQLGERPIFERINFEFWKELGILTEMEAVNSKEVVYRLREKGDYILKSLRRWTPVDGELYEQFDKKTGAPVSSKGLGWAHSAYLEAFMDRQRLMRLIGESK